MSAPDLTGTPIEQLISLEGRSAVVTGGAAGIGYAVAERLAEAGANVLIGDLDGAETAAETIASSYGARCEGVHLDVTDTGSVQSCAASAVDRFGSVDIWVNNAGIYPSTSVLEMTDDDWDRVHDVNIRGYFIGAREAARHMVGAEHGGVIINMASIAAFRAGGAGIVHYTSSKHGLLGLTKSLAVELGPVGIRVLTIAPTMIETPGILTNADALRAAGNADLWDSFAERMPLRRLGKPDDVARVVLFAVSDLAAFMTGSALMVDAGDLAQ
jgi:NAD(P)-dependent dehydrogenase (short-subunit alcohol dehydrogenase family)